MFVLSSCYEVFLFPRCFAIIGGMRERANLRYIYSRIRDSIDSLCRDETDASSNSSVEATYSLTTSI